MVKKTAVVTLLCAVTATTVEQKDISMLSLASTISSNLGLLTLSKKAASQSSIGEDSEFVQLTQKIHAGDDLDDMLRPGDDEDDQEEEEQPEQTEEAEQPVQPAEPIQNEMSLTEQMVAAQKEMKALDEKTKKEAEEKKKKDAADAKVKAEKEKMDAEQAKKDAPRKKVEAEEKEMDDFINSQLEAQKKHREEYDAELNQDIQKEDDSPKEKTLSEKVDQELERAKTKKKTGAFSSTEDAMDTIGQSLAEHQLDYSIEHGAPEPTKIPKENSPQQKQIISQMVDDPSLNVAALAERMQVARKDLQEIKEEDQGPLEDASASQIFQALADVKALPAQSLPAIEQEIPSLLSQAQQLKDVEDDVPPQEASVLTEKDVNADEKALEPMLPQPAAPAVNMQSLIQNAVAHQAKPAPPKIDPKLMLAVKKMKKPKAPKPTLPRIEPVMPAMPKIAAVQNTATSTLVAQQLQKDQAEQGVEAPSDITKALIEQSDGEEPQGNGFFGKYLKKHIDMKKSAEAKIAQKQKEEADAKMARIAKMKEELSEKLKPEPVVPSENEEAPKPVKKKKLSLFERAQEKIMKESEDKQQQVQDEVKAQVADAIQNGEIFM